MPGQGTHWVYSGGEMAPRCLPSGARRTTAKREGHTTGHLAFPPPHRCGCGRMLGRVGSEGALSSCGGGGGGPLLINLAICLFTGRSRCAGAVLFSLQYSFNKHGFDPIPAPPVSCFFGLFVCLAIFSRYT